jgi:thymidylate synthase
MIDWAYVSIIEDCLRNGELIRTRNANAYRVIASTWRFETTPLVSARKTAWKNALREWEWFMSGSSNIKDLHPAVHSWWQPWANGAGVVWNNYSSEFRAFCGVQSCVDQIELLIEGIKEHPYSRRNVITTWNTADMHDRNTPITNCHGTVIQAFVDLANKLHLVTYQRSVDVICGLPHNWVQYWAFLMWLAHRGNRQVGSLTWIGGDVHVYEAHQDLAKRVVKAAGEVKEPTPQLIYQPTSDDFKADDFTLSMPYEPVLIEKAEMFV